MVYAENITIDTQGFSDIRDITESVREIVRRSAVKEGIANVFGIGSTQTITVIEYEPALVEDVKEILEKLVPSSLKSRHSQTWGDDNGWSHMRGTLFNSETTIPVTNGDILTGTWQQIVIIDHDNRPRHRQIRVTVVGER